MDIFGHLEHSHFKIRLCLCCTDSRSIFGVIDSLVEDENEGNSMLTGNSLSIVGIIDIRLEMMHIIWISKIVVGIHEERSDRKIDDMIRFIFLLEIKIKRLWSEYGSSLFDFGICGGNSPRYR